MALTDEDKAWLDKRFDGLHKALEGNIASLATVVIRIDDRLGRVERHVGLDIVASAAPPERWRDR